jgi:NAD(P)-dependent dehydrogenase (short-subunit alcohol dehydrogenase family)
MNAPDQPLPAFPKVALITGAAGIIGPEIARILKEAGWKIAAADYSKANFERHRVLQGTNLDADLCLIGDLARREDCVHLVEETTARLGPLGLLVNGATANTQQAPLAALDEATVDRLLRVDLLAPLYLSQAAAAGLGETRGLIVNLSSVRVHDIVPGNLLYTVAKAGLEKMTEALAVELAPLRVRVNAIRIGAVPGNAFLRAAADLLPPELAAKLQADILPAHTALGSRYSLTGRAGLASDIGNMIAYLASPAGEFINGAVLPVDGGFVLSQQANSRQPAGEPSLSARWANDPRGELRKWLQEKGLADEA